MPNLSWPLPVLASALVLAAAASLLVASWPRRITADQWLTQRRLRRVSREERAGPWLGRWARRTWAWLDLGVGRCLPGSARASLTALLRTAALEVGPERAVSLTVLLTVLVGLGTLAWSSQGTIPLSLAVLLTALLPLGLLARLVQRASRRRRAIADQLPILVDLMALEQGGGGVGARSAMEMVVGRLGGEAALLLRECLTASATSGSPQLDRQLERAGDEFRIPALSAIAAVIRVQRDEGVASSSPLGQLARGLRDRQRDELLARGRRALVTMLLPVAVCILLPFVLIVLYPALARLSTAFS